MRLLRAATFTLILTSLSLPLRPADGGGFGGGEFPADDPPKGVKYEPVRLPLSAKSARTWITLRETMVKPSPDQTPLAMVIQSLRDATRGKGPRLRIYIDPASLHESEITMTTPIAAPFVGEDEVSLNTYLGFILKPFGLTHRVHDNLVVIDSPCDDCPAPVEVSAAEAWTWLLLHEEVPLHFPDETPLNDVLKAIHEGTVGKGPGGRGLVIHLDPTGLREARKATDSPVTIDMEDVPLCTSLGLVLNQLGLGFRVREDGVLVVTHLTVSDENLLMDEFETLEAYQLERYSSFWERHNAKAASRKRDDPDRPLKKSFFGPEETSKLR